MQSLSMLGVLVGGTGGLIIVASWDARIEQHYRVIDFVAYILAGAGIALFVAGVVQ